MTEGEVELAQKFDIIILGGGNAGFGVSAVAHEAGMNIAFVEERDFGGTCPNRGCTPKKVLVAAAHAMHELELAQKHCIVGTGTPTIDWPALIKRKNEMIEFIPGAMAELAAKRGTVFRGRGTFTGPNSVEVNGETLEAESIVIATGSRTRPLPFPGAENLITSDEVLSEEQRPQDVVFVGGGVIAMEFSHVYARAGTKVTILEAMPQLLPRMDSDAVAAIRAETERLGVKIKTDVSVSKVEKNGEKLQIQFTHEGAPHVIEADRIVNGAGRIANTEGLQLEAAEVEHDGIAIKVDSHMRSISNPRIWVAGDALVSSPQLSPVATYEGRTVGHSIVEGIAAGADISVLPSCVYTVPALATVGLTEADARTKGLNYDAMTHDMTGWFSARFYAETVAWAKILVDKESGLILGAHMVGHNAEELIHIFAMAMRFQITSEQLKASQFAFPTFSSDVKSMV